jgi:hypothetical protein
VYVSVYLTLGICTGLTYNNVYYSVQEGEKMSLIRWLKVIMTCLFFAALVSLLVYSCIIKVAVAWSGVPDKGVELIATMQDGDVNVYSIDGTSCFAIVGELHGKTVAMVCP